MKTKGIPIWEQYLEHIVLGIAVLVLLGFTAMQFIGSPNAVEVAGTGTVGPADVDQILEKKAQDIGGSMRDKEISLEPPTPVLAKFEEMKKSSISPRSTLQHALAPRISPVPQEVATVGDRPFVVPNIAAPFNLITQQYRDTLSEEIVTEFPDLREVLPPSSPYDISWITASATFDAAAVLQQFGSVGPNGEAPLPPRWYDNAVYLVDVRIEREELNGKEWGNLTLLKPIPGQVSFRENLAARIDAATRDQILGTVATPEGRNAVIRPEFYPGSAAAWAPPAEREVQRSAATPEELAILDLQSRLTRNRKEYERVNAQFTKLGCPAEEPEKPEKPKQPRPGGRPATPAGDEGGGAQGAGGGRQIGGGNQPTTPNTESQCRGLRRKLKTLKTQIEKDEAELQSLQAAAPVEAPADEPEQLDKLVVWGHDIAIQSGKAYRYRITIDIHNPLFLRGNELLPAQKHMAETFALASATSEWSAPIYAHPPLRLFVTNAKPMGTALGQLPAGTASAEVFRFRDGRWWQESFAVQPGDRIGGVKSRQSEVDYSTDWFVLDVVPDIAADQNNIAQGLGAMVLLQSLTDEGVTEVRYPSQDAVDPERAYLRQEAQSAKEAGAVAKK